MSSVVTKKGILFGFLISIEVEQEPLERRLKLLEGQSLSMVASLQKFNSRHFLSQ